MTRPFLALGLLLLLTAGCRATGLGAAAPEISAPAWLPLQPLARDQYQVLAPVEGRASYRSTLLVDAIAGASTLALYQALDQVEAADMLVTPRYRWVWKEAGVSPPPAPCRSRTA